VISRRRVVVIGGWAPSLLKFRGPLLAAMVARGHHVLAMAGDEDAATTAGLAALGVEFIPISVQRTGIDPRRDGRLLFELHRRLRALKPDCVFNYTIKPVIYGTLAARSVAVAQRAAMITGLGYSFAPPTSVKHAAVAAVARAMYRLALASCHTVFFQNPDDRDEFARLGLTSRHNRVEVVRGSGVDIAHYAAQPLPQGPPHFLFIGRLLQDKGIREYVEMAKTLRQRYPTSRFRVVGWIDGNPASVRQAELDGWVRDGIIEFIGAIDDVRPEIARCQVLVLPSYREGTPRSVLEAMSMARAVITTSAPGCRETVVDGESGLLVPVQDVAALATAARRLIDEPGLLRSLATAARQRIERLYDASVVASQMLDVLAL
jgi:glycosyltransferase involved in cell wall biosynthesis